MLLSLSWDIIRIMNRRFVTLPIQRPKRNTVISWGIFSTTGTVIGLESFLTRPILIPSAASLSLIILCLPTAMCLSLILCIDMIVIVLESLTDILYTFGTFLILRAAIFQNCRLGI